MNAIQPHVSMYLFNPLSLYIFAKVAENGGPWSGPPHTSVIIPHLTGAGQSLSLCIELLLTFQPVLAIFSSSNPTILPPLDLQD
jgi:hypothetical protein